MAILIDLVMPHLGINPTKTFHTQDINYKVSNCFIACDSKILETILFIKKVVVKYCISIQ